MMKRTLISTAVAFALSIPFAASVPAQQGSEAQQGSQQQAQMQQGNQQQESSRIKIVSPFDLIGRTVLEQTGQKTGELSYAMIDLASGDVRYAIISVLGSAGDAGVGEEFIAIPWSTLQLPATDEQPLKVNASFEKLQKAPRMTVDTLVELTQPSVITQVYDYYLVPQSASQAGGAQQQNQGGQSGTQTQTQQSQSAQQQGQSAQQQAQSGQSTAQTQAQQGQSTQQQAHGGQMQAQQGAQGQPQGGQGGMPPHILVGREFVTVIAPPVMMSATQVHGTEVIAPNGEEAGEISRLMVDAERGHIAYVLLARGGYLGLGGEWVPIPFEILQWSQDGQNFVLNVSEEQLQQMQGLPKVQDLPTQVRRDQLENLYDSYGITPYWAEQGQQGQQQGQQQG